MPSCQRGPVTYADRALERVDRFEHLELEVAVEAGTGEEALHRLERARVELTAEKGGEPVVDEEYLARALQLGQGAERRLDQAERELRMFDRVLRRERGFDPALGQRRVAQGALEVPGLDSGIAARGRRGVGVAPALVARIGCGL